ncbi:MAG: hypothetical protein Q9195_004482 [Heterodermia aff. obscurata]
MSRKRKDAEIQRVKKRLEDYQRALDTVVLADVRQMIVLLIKRHDHQSTNVDQELVTLAKRLESCQISTADTLQTEINSVIEANKHEHKETRLHLDGTVQALTASQAKQQEQTTRHERFLESLRFDDIHVRENEVSESHLKTFNWVYDDDGEHPWDSLKAWLELGQGIYWINGKAGSGKSTFMKFLVNDERTSKALDIWSGDRDCMILNHYFWLSGTKFQRSMKGFLCSLLHKIVNSNEVVLGGTIDTRKELIRKRSLEDWSIGELRKTLRFAIELVNRTGYVCIFVDGIDEFDRNEDVQQLLDFIQELAELPKTKLCLSSRPEVQIERFLSRCPKLRLQDLTAKDMEICIRDRLSSVYERCPSIAIKAKDIDQFLWLMTEKADGVFLWVYFALSSLLKGMSNEDDFEVLLTRLEELPSGMERLYQEMWLRLNGDEQRYRKESNLYFSYHEFFPVSLFHMMVALNGNVQTKYFEEMRPQDPTLIAQKCEVLRKRILVTCAGLLEVTETKHDEPSSFTSRTDSFESSTQKTKGLEETVSNDDHQLEDEEESRGLLNGPPASHPTALGESFGVPDGARSSLQLYRDSKIKFLHRTARDFLLDTKAGQAIVGETSQTRDDRFSNLMRARMAALLQGLEEFSAVNFYNIMEYIGDFDTKDEIDLLETLRHICEALHVSGSPTRDVTLSNFWVDRLEIECPDFVGIAAYTSCTKYVQWYVDHATPCVSPYYLGYLLRTTTPAFENVTEPVIRKSVQSAGLLAEKGADLYTNQILLDGHISKPFTALLEAVLFSDEWDIMTETAIEAARLIERLYPTAMKQKEKFVLYARLPIELPRFLGLTQLKYEIEYNDLCRLALYHLRCNAVVTGRIKIFPTRSSSPVKVLLLERQEEHGHDPGTCLRPTPEDSIYLGQAYEKVLFPEDYTDAPAQSLETFVSRVKAVFPRCKKVDEPQWEYEKGLLIDLPDNTLTLDPSEDVNETNWQERGWFRTTTRNPRHGSVFTVMNREPS